MTNRTLHRIVLPHFFAHIDFRPAAKRNQNTEARFQPYVSRSEDGSTTFRRLAVLMLQRPDLARMVRSFCMRPGFHSDLEIEVDEVPQYPPCLVEIDPILEKAVGAHAHSEKEKRIWIRALKRRDLGFDHLNDDPVLALLLPCLPDLRRLALQVPNHAPYMERMMDRCAVREKPFDTNLVAFSRLENIGSTYFEDHHGMKRFWFARCFRMQSIKRVFLKRVGCGPHTGEIHVDETLARLPPRSSPCEHIELRGSKLSDHDIKKTLEVCLSLKTFICELGWRWLNSSWPDIQKLMDALGLHKDTLQDLYLDLTHYGEVEEDDILFAPILLANFSSLKHVKINPAFLIGRLEGENIIADTPRRLDLDNSLPELLSRSLQRLCITNAQNSFEEVMAGLEKLLAEQETSHPLLEELTLEGPWSEMPYWPELRAISIAAQCAKIAFIARDNRYPGQNDKFGGGFKQRWGMDDEFCWDEFGLKAEPLEFVNVDQCSLQSSKFGRRDLQLTQFEENRLGHAEILSAKLQT